MVKVGRKKESKGEVEKVDKRKCVVVGGIIRKCGSEGRV